MADVSPTTSNFPNQSQAFRLEMWYWIVGQSVSTNQTTFGWSVWIKKNRTYSMNSSGGSAVSATFNGQTVLSIPNFAYDLSSNNEVMLGQGVITLTHNPDGTLGLAGVQASANVTYLGSTTTPMEYTTAPTIPRASVATFSGSSSFPAGEAKTINTNRASSSFTHKIEYQLGSSSGTIATGVGASYSWTPPLSLLTQMPDTTSRAGTIYVTTYDGSTQIGSRTSLGFTLTAGAAAVPSVSATTFTDSNSTVESVVGAFVQNLSRAIPTVTASGYQGSTITSRAVTIAGVTAAPGTSFALPTSGTVTAKTDVTDSRSRTATRNDSLSVLAYTPPTVTSSNVRRATSAGVVNAEGTYLRVDVNGFVKSLVNSTERNGLTIEVRTRAGGGGAWTSRNTINGALTYNSNFLVTGGGIYAVSSSYDVEVTLSDKVGQSWVKIFTIPTGAVTMQFSGTNVGIGKYWERGALDVAGTAYISSHLYVEGSFALTGSMTSGSVPNARLTELSNGLTIATTPPVITDANQATTPGFYILSSSGTNNPIPGQEVSIQVIGNSTRQTQIATRIFGMDRVFKRYRSGSPMSWGAWQVTFDERSGDARMAAGIGAHDAVNASGGAVATTITFPSGRFTAAPIASVTNRGGGSTNRVTQMIQAISATSMTVWTSNWTTANAPAGNFHWTAIQVL